MNLKTEDYRVKAGKAVSLKSWKTDEKGSMDKEVGKVTATLLADELAEWQERLYAENKQALLIVLQARDAGGKDGTVKHVIGAFNPNGVRISNFKVPSEEELAHDFLWRIHTQTPRKGMVAVFNRSHYEDVLVTRVHNLIDHQTAQQRLEHIRNFESLLTDSGTRVLKFYLHISKEEQEERLQDRLDHPDKLWKFNAGDLEERALWDEYTSAYQDALTTSTEAAPWYVIPADHKWFRNLLISQIILDTLKDMNPQFPETDLNPAEIKIK
ncbi:polyphosphate kinase 2 family protein [Deinococcus humi]|uniref:PPK2 family polyphosphate:nucleotide phosphotransferase n=1 Tax=Deinococcus humi TaxID=662880 RepID=A0A7W8JXZ1_9DEIO|nr:polyphosphate kinase 2 family protein [Deinococcus humi]MBB5365194.1 PPK2 family polyphosphate:nucleotide phosphotransferase [Deinococcus humi]GGO37609.1 polyphosphate kinase [Deinococcus humi]